MRLLCHSNPLIWGPEKGRELFSVAKGSFVQWEISMLSWNGFTGETSCWIESIESQIFPT